VLPEPTAVTLRVIDTLDAIGIPYLIGGSFASSIHGVARMTADVDLVVDLKKEHVGPLVRALETEFYVDAEAILDAIRRHESFNLVHLATMFKVDIFVLKRRSFDRAQFERRQRHAISKDPERHAYIATAEDSILAKLEWYRMGGETSDRQWNDIQNVIKTQSDRLDVTYMRHWAVALGIADLLDRALSEGSS
jgi:hypothetical protein